MEVYQRWERGTLYVGDVMSKPVRTVSELLSVQDAAKVMTKHGIGCVVVGRQRLPVGIVTEGDILRRGVGSELDLRTTHIGKLMSKPLIMIGEDATIEAAAELMTTNSVKRLPVLKNGKLVGIITATDIVRKEPVLARLIDELARHKQGNA
jgi:CBS domain-containing protein